jgi:hypothetical protein
MKKILLISTLLLTLAAPMRAQVFVMEEEENEFRNVFGNGEWNNVILHNSADDQTNFVPLGGGILLLSALGGAYLAKDKRKKLNNK